MGDLASPYSRDTRCLDKSTSDVVVSGASFQFRGYHEIDARVRYKV